MSLFIPPRPSPAKAVIGPGALAMTYQTPLAALSMSPQKLCEQAQKLYRENNWVYDAEHTVATRAGAVEWHLEDKDAAEVDDTADPKYKAIRDLLEKPQAQLSVEERQGPLQYRRNLWTLTLRHMALCGYTFWYLDRTDALAGIPLAILYLNPARVYAVMTKGGNLVGWTLDKPPEEGGTPLELANVLPFYFDPADTGPYGIGLVESIWAKAQISQYADRHIATTLAGGGRLTGIISPKEAGAVNDDQWAQLVRDYRNITADPDAAKRLQIVKGPIDYTRTAASMQELMIPDIARLGRDDVLAHWGVPGSQIGVAVPAGLNSGSTKAYDEAVLWQGAIHPRLQSFEETLQYGLLDRYAERGIVVDLVIDEPEFDDDAPLYSKAAQAREIPLTNDERRGIVNLPPFEKDLESFGKMVWLPIGLTEVAGPGFEEPEPISASLMLGGPPESIPPQPVSPEIPEEGKARIRPNLLSALRRQIDHAFLPKMRSAVAAALLAQKADVIARLQKLGLAHLRTRRRDTAGWWIARTHDRALMDALRPHVGAIASKVASRTDAILSPAMKPAKASFGENVATRVLTKGAGRVTEINGTTRKAIQDAIADAIDGAETIEDVIRAVEALPAFDPYRAELIARTESMFAYNASALGSYEELGVEMVEPIDGDDDDECRARMARGAVTLAEAEADEDHPNGTLDWAPVLSEQPAKAETTPTVPASTRVTIEYDQFGRVVAVGEYVA